MNQLDDTERAFCAIGVGFVYQFHHLLPDSRPGKVAMPLLVRRMNPAAAREAAAAILIRVDWRRGWAIAVAALRRRASAAAVARRWSSARWYGRRAPGNLDGVNAAQVFELMLELNRNSGPAW